MNSDLWKGSNLPISPRVLILGESHYDDDNFGEKVSFSTSGVVKNYFESRYKWSRFFDKMAASFGYDRDNARQFFEKVFFGNYIDVVCGIGDSNAKHYADLNRDTYNSEWFDFINQNEIDVVVCFSKLAYNHFPSLNTAEGYEIIGKEYVGDIGSKPNYVEYCTYAPGIEHKHSSVKLVKPLKLYGISHPSARGGYDCEQIYKYISKQEDLGQICFADINRSKEQVPESFLIKASTICTMFLKERSDIVNTQELRVSFYQYVRAFCLMLATLCKHYSNIDYRSLINHITMSSLGEISDDDYCMAIDDRKLKVYETYLMANHGIIHALRRYDMEYSSSSSSMEAFLRMLSMLAIVFVEIDKNNYSVVNNDVPELIKNVRDRMLVAQVDQPSRGLVQKEQTQAKVKTANLQNNRKHMKTSEVDALYFVRVIIPLLATISLGLFAFSERQLWACFVGIIPLCFLISGIKENGRRCPSCRAWHSFYVSRQEFVKQDKVKVRRPLGVAYFRTSGRATFGVRQTFVSAEEKIYNTTIKCSVCGYEFKELRSVIDDKIR